MSAPSPLIFIIDDDRGMLRLIEKTLQREAFTTAAAAAARDALQWLQENRPALMLLDLKLQDMEGQEVVNHLNSIGISVPFIVITGQGDERVAVEMMKRGALDYLVKDGNFLTFLPAVVRRALDQIERDRRLAAVEQERRILERQIIEISERERRRIGQDLHDGLGQHLTGIELMTQALEQKLDGKSKSEAAQAAKISQHVRDAIRQTRALARGLSPVELDASGLMSALHELAANVRDMFRVECAFRCDTPVLIRENTVATHLFRIAQEAVSNSIKHGKASHIEIALTASADGLVLTVADNGKGIPSDISGTAGMGLRIMRYRASVVGGTFSAERAASDGTIVTCWIPEAKQVLAETS